jgi:hypothetical protein
MCLAHGNRRGTLPPNLEGGRCLRVMEILHELWLFVSMVFETWEAYVFAGVVGVFVGIYEHFRERSIPWKVLKYAMLAFLPISCFMVWREQYHAVILAKAETGKVQASLDALNNPILSGEISAISAAPSGPHKEDALVTIVLRLRNNGAPTALEDFRLTVTNRGTQFKTQFVPVVPMRLFYGPGNKSSIVLRTEDHVNKILSSHVLDRHALADAWFQVVVFGLSRETALSTDTVFVVSYRDIATGSEHSLIRRSTGIGEFPLDIQKLSRETR